MCLNNLDTHAGNKSKRVVRNPQSFRPTTGGRRHACGGKKASPLAQPYVVQSLTEQQLSLPLVRRCLQIGGFAFWQTDTGGLIMGNGYGEAMELGLEGEARLIKLLSNYFDTEF